MPIWNVFSAGFLGLALIAGSANASTLVEGAGNFSNSWVAPTDVATGTTDVSGSGAPSWVGGDRVDVFLFSGLTPGKTSILFDFSLTGSYSDGRYQNGGGSIYYSYVPFTGDFYVEQANGNVLGSSDLLAGVFDVTYDPWTPNDSSRQGTSSFTLGLGDEFAGDLFLAMDFTYGKVSYNINSLNWSASANDSSPSPVPLPASGLLLLAGFSGLGFIARRRKRS